MTLYNLRSDGTITKWDADGNIQAQYSVSEDGCTCPAGHRHTCRHRQMLPSLLPIADTHWFLDWDNGRRVVDFNGTSKTAIDMMIQPGEYNPPVDLPAEQDTLHLGEPLITIEGEMKNQFVVVESKPTTALAPSWRRI